MPLLIDFISQLVKDVDGGIGASLIAYGRVAFVSARVLVRGTPPGMFATA
jgi:hypothetical protein